MRNFNKLAAVVAFGALLLSCGTGHKLTSSVTPAQLTDIQLFEPATRNGLIQKGNNVVMNDSVTAISKRVLRQALLNHADVIPITGDVIVADTAVQRQLQEEIETLCIALAQFKQSYGTLTLLPVADSLLQATGKRFGMMVCSSGFIRDKGNYGNQIVKGIGMGLLTTVMTLGMLSIYEIPYKTGSSVYVIIADAENHNVAFARCHAYEEFDPLDVKHLDRQLKRLFKGYFQLK